MEDTGSRVTNRDVAAFEIPQTVRGPTGVGHGENFLQVDLGDGNVAVCGHAAGRGQQGESFLVDPIAIVVGSSSVDVGEETDAVEFFAGDLVELLLQLDELLGVVFGVRRTLGYVVRIGPQLGHSIEEFADHLEGAVLHLQKGQAVLNVDPNRLSPLERGFHLVGYRKATGVVVGSDDPVARGELGQAVAKHVVGPTEVERGNRGGCVSIYCYWHVLVPPRWLKRDWIIACQARLGGGMETTLFRNRRIIFWIS